MAKFVRLPRTRASAEGDDASSDRLTPTDTIHDAHDANAPVGVEDPEESSIIPDPDDDHVETEGDPPDVMDDSVGPFGNPVDATPIAPTRRSGRNRMLTQRYIEAMEQRDEGIVAFVATHETIDPLLYQEDKALLQLETDPIACALKATSDPDTMYYHQAMKEPDAEQFKAAMTKEVDAHTAKKHWEIVRREQVPSGIKVLPSVWAMKRKQRIDTREIYKWKARLNIGGHMMEHRVHFQETYSPVVRWTTIRLCLVLSLIFGWSTRQLDFVQAYPQAKASTDNIYIEVPQGIDFPRYQDLQRV